MNMRVIGRLISRGMKTSRIMYKEMMKLVWSWFFQDRVSSIASTRSDNGVKRVENRRKFLESKSGSSWGGACLIWDKKDTVEEEEEEEEEEEGDDDDVLYDDDDDDDNVLDKVSCNNGLIFCSCCLSCEHPLRSCHFW